MRHFQPTAGIVLRFTRGRCRALPFALASLSCSLHDSCMERVTGLINCDKLLFAIVTNGDTHFPLTLLSKSLRVGMATDNTYAIS